jgi:hypothetical protein
LASGRVALMMPLWGLGTASPAEVAARAQEASLETFLRNVDEFNNRVRLCAQPSLCAARSA